MERLDTAVEHFGKSRMFGDIFYGTTQLTDGLCGTGNQNSGVAGAARMNFSRDGVAGDAAGATSLAFRDPLHGVALGGRIAVATDTANQVAFTTDGGITWTRSGRPPFSGAVYGSAYRPVARAPLLLAAGPGGLAASRDDGATWEGLSTNAYWAVGFGSARTGWAVGPRGRITRIAIE